MNTIRHIRRLTSILAVCAAAVLALAAASPAMAATASIPPYGPGVSPAPALVHTVITGGMPAWQVTLIAAGAAILAAILAVTADRARAARRHVTAPSL
jgi:hypothetical protein